VRVESGEVGGVYCIVTETTERVVGERRLALLKDLAERNATARTARDACVLATDTLSAKPQDILFAFGTSTTTCKAPLPERRNDCGRRMDFSSSIASGAIGSHACVPCRPQP
jgi:hypothetical protein